MSWDSLKDKVFKDKFREQNPKLLFNNKYLSDIEFEHLGLTYLIEYENSSRGMTSNLARIYDLFLKKPKKLKVLFIRTSKHVRSYNRDFNNCSIFYSLIKEKHPEFEVLFMEAKNFTGELP